MKRVAGMTEQEYKHNIKRIKRAIKRDQMLEMGICPHCKSGQIIPGKTWCAECAEKKRALERENSRKRKEARIEAMPESETRDVAVALIRLTNALEGYEALPCEREEIVGQLRRAVDMIVGKDAQKAKAPEKEPKTNMSKSEQRRAMREAHEAMGMCVKCSQPARPGHKTCLRCGLLDNDAKRERMAKLEAAGLCIQCGKRPPAEGRRRCEECLQYMREHRQKQGETQCTRT